MLISKHHSIHNSFQNGFPYDTDDCTMTSVPGDTASGPTSIDMLSAISANEKYRRSSSPSYANFTTSGSSLGHKKAVTVGICAMEKKSLSKPMKEILTRLEEFEYIHTTIFPEEIILNVRKLHFIKELISSKNRIFR